MCNCLARIAGKAITRQHVTGTSFERCKTTVKPRQDSTKALSCTRIRDLHMNKSHEKQRNVQRVLRLIQIAKQRHIQSLKDLIAVFCLLQRHRTISGGITCIHFSTTQRRLMINRREYFCKRSTLSCSRPTRLKKSRVSLDYKLKRHRRQREIRSLRDLRVCILAFARDTERCQAG